MDKKLVELRKRVKTLELRLDTSTGLVGDLLTLVGSYKVIFNFIITPNQKEDLYYYFPELKNRLDELFSIKRKMENRIIETRSKLK